MEEHSIMVVRSSWIIFHTITVLHDIPHPASPQATEMFGYTLYTTFYKWLQKPNAVSPYLLPQFVLQHTDSKLFLQQFKSKT